MPVRLLLLLTLLATAASAQPPQAFVDEFIAALRSGDPQRVHQFTTSRLTIFSASGTTLPVGTSTSPRAAFVFTLWKSRVVYLRHLRAPTPDTALAVAIWRNPTAKPPLDAGALDIVFRKEDTAWKVFTWRESYLPAVNTPAGAPAPPVSDPDSLLSEKDRNEGWRLLFNGQNSDGWITVSGDSTLPRNWKVADGALSAVPAPQRVALITREAFRHFDLLFEWKAAPKANSGVQYQLFAQDMFIDGVASSATGPEYQIADDEGEPGAAADDRSKSGALYAVIPVSRPSTKPLGEWNQSRILLSKGRVEHWLNGVMTASYPMPDVFSSPILLQHHGPGVSFRNIRIRPLTD